MARERFWLDLDLVELAVREARARGVASVATSRRGFASAFRRAGGTPDRLGVHTSSGQAWRDRRNGFVARHMAQVTHRGEPLWTSDGAPTNRHLALAVWAYSPSPKRLRRWLEQDQD